ncbi:hypothetical protein SDC9_79747 [bioreactor metagenome]|uniref:Uncharacterized protein n=1 Tax=bioreactor metagenome TaxID=1076179 RepID=A0A644YYR7_9ZZZZ
MWFLSCSILNVFSLMESSEALVRISSHLICETISFSDKSPKSFKRVSRIILISEILLSFSIASFYLCIPHKSNQNVS